MQISLEQGIANKANSRVDFTTVIDRKLDKRYIVSVSPLYVGKNPSMDPNIILSVGNAVDKGVYGSIGGWRSSDSGDYHLDANMHFDDLEEALIIATGHAQEAIYDQTECEVIYV